ncbi:MAG: NUDIX domain-containing protein [Paludibacteraceae bacterium]|nr:NUDIX domain-containing protein [Paludibacteraceae bacterium]
MTEHPLNIFKHCPKCGSDKFVENDSRSKKCLDCSFVYYQNAAAAVAGIIRNERNEILVTTRGIEPKKGKLDLPGGFVEFAETAEEALRREIKEELNIEVKNIKFEFSMPNIYRFSDMNVRTLDLIFSCEACEATRINPQDDVKDAKYMNVNDLNEEDFGLDSIKNAIRIIKNGAEMQK